MRAAILTHLAADAALAALLPGGLYDAAAVGRIGRQRTPGAFDANRELRACALLRLPADSPGPIRPVTRAEATIYLYAPATLDGRAAVEGARHRLRALLHRVRVAPAAGQSWALQWTGDVADLEEPDLDAAYAICRYLVLADNQALAPTPAASPTPSSAISEGSAL